MANVIAVVWDCDKTLIDGYMQDPMFKRYGVDSRQFWGEVSAECEGYARQGIRVNRDFHYLNKFIRGTRDGTFPKLSNAVLREFGQEQKFYPGIPEFFEKTKNLLLENAAYSEYGIKVEHYIVSTGFAEVIRGSALMPYVDDIWGCELLEAPDADGDPVISEIAYAIDNTTKTRALFEINKGRDVDVNASVPKEKRRVQFRNMIYIADGPSDIPAFSLIRQNGGATFAIYPRGDRQAIRQVEQMRADGRVDMYAEADYTEGTTADMWITEKIRMIADRILREEQERMAACISCAPKHLQD